MMPRVFLYLVLWLPLQGVAQELQVVSPFTTAEFRSQFDTALVKWSILNNLKGSLHDSDEEYDFQNAFWPMELIGYRTDYARQRIAYAFSRAASCSVSFQRALLENAYGNWPTEFSAQITQLMAGTRDPEVFALCVEYLRRGGLPAAEPGRVRQLIASHFADLRTDPMLLMLAERLGGAPTPPLPPLKDLLSEAFAPGLTVVYSFQRPDRDYPGLVVVRKPDGSFVRGTSGIFAVPQLARSVTDVPFYLHNGNTPQGVYRMSGFDVSRSRFIGPTENIQLSLPYEIPLDSFLISPLPEDTGWNRAVYGRLLPESWQGYGPLYHAYYAGQAGRTAIIAHGTTINPAYYQGQPYYPQTPSLGCLCTHESWDPLTGQRLDSDQQKLVDAVKQAGIGVGYAVVVNLADKKAPVSLDEVLPALLAAEGSH